MSDRRLRELERKAAVDPEAAEALKVERQRACTHAWKYWAAWSPGKPFRACKFCDLRQTVTMKEVIRDGLPHTLFQRWSVPPLRHPWARRVRVEASQVDGGRTTQLRASFWFPVSSGEWEEHGTTVEVSRAEISRGRNCYALEGAVEKMSDWLDEFALDNPRAHLAQPEPQLDSIRFYVGWHGMAMAPPPFRLMDTS